LPLAETATLLAGAGVRLWSGAAAARTPAEVTE